MNNKKLNELEEFLGKLPSISKKNAKKLSIILATKKDMANDLIKVVQDIKDIHKCPYCNNLTDSKYCDNCVENKPREVIVINSFNDLINLEKAGINNMHPFILDNNGMIDLNKIDLSQLTTFIDRSKIKELVVFISPTVEGKILTKKIIELTKFKKIKTSQLRIGIPFGAAIETIDSITLKESLNKREEVE
jgi:recombination protein RecR